MNKIIILIISIGMPSLLFTLSMEDSNSYSEYKGVPVTYDLGVCNNDYDYACYFWDVRGNGKRRNTINVQSYNNKEHLDFLLEHESGHNLYQNHLTDKERGIVDNMFSGKYDNLLQNNGVQLGYMAEYTKDPYYKTNTEEAFAEMNGATEYWKAPKTGTDAWFYYQVTEHYKNKYGF